MTYQHRGTALVAGRRRHVRDGRMMCLRQERMCDSQIQSFAQSASPGRLNASEHKAAQIIRERAGLMPSFPFPQTRHSTFHACANLDAPPRRWHYT